MNRKRDDDNLADISQQVFGDAEVPDEKNDAKQPLDEAINNPYPDLVDSGEIISGVKNTLKKTKRYTNTSPEMSSNDIEADWEKEAQTTGEETSLGSNATPDQDQVENISEPWGTTYESKAELDVRKKAKELERDREEDADSGLDIRKE